MFTYIMFRLRLIGFAVPEMLRHWSNSRNKEKKVVKVQKPVVEKRQEEVGSKYVK